MTAPIYRAIVILALTLSAAVLALALTPTVEGQGAEFDIETIIPHKFGDWRTEVLGVSTVVNPQTEAVLNQLYSKLLSRTYINNEGRHIMLSLAYGADQSHGKQIHKPEVCYPAQGFQIKSKKKDVLRVGSASLPVMRIVTQLDRRHEPVTYWIRLGDVLVRGLVEQTFARIRYGFGGHIPDGILFRVSEINPDIHDSFALQDRFINDLLPALTPDAREILLGSDWSE